MRDGKLMYILRFEIGENEQLREEERIADAGRATIVVGQRRRRRLERRCAADGGGGERARVGTLLLSENIYALKNNPSKAELVRPKKRTTTTKNHKNPFFPMGKNEKF